MTSGTLSLDYTPFPNYTQLSKYLPQSIWHSLRVLSVVSAFAMAYVLWTNSIVGLQVFWGLAIPLLPLVFFIAPGIWRNICPLAASNQLPRAFGISRSATNTTLSQGLAFPIGMLGFFALVTARKLLFNDSGEATAILIAGAMAAALAGGLLFKGKSGWCSSVCPLLPVQRLYGQTPFVKVANTHCQPCVGCAKNCYDFNPGTAYLADQYDAKRGYRSFRRFFAGVFPGFVLAYYLVPSPPNIAMESMVLQIVMYMALSLALFNLLDTAMQAMVNLVPVVFAVAAINIYYWFSAPTVVNTLSEFGLLLPDAVTWVIRGAILTTSLVWLWRSVEKERLYLADQERQAKIGELKLTPIVIESLTEFSGKVQPARKLLTSKANPDTAEECFDATKREASTDADESIEPELCIAPDGKRTPLRQGQSLLDAIEACDGKIESGCRAGVCGADPIAVTEGMEHLSPVGPDEGATLKRLGCAENTRMACSARLRGQGAVKIELAPHRQTPSKLIVADHTTQAGDPGIRSVVIIGNGVAGIAAAEHTRRLHPTCEIHVISRENHALYNRMGIARLINDRSGMHGLHLHPESWYPEHRITHWLNTHAVGIDTDKRRVLLATREHVAYDRLILANGSSAQTPDIHGFGEPGSFVLREADDAMNMRDYIQRHEAHTAIVAGAGLLGLEAAHALQKMGLKVTVLSASEQILKRQLDVQSGILLRRYLENQGVGVLSGVEAAALSRDNNGRVNSAHLKDDRVLPTDIFLSCIGVRPNVELAQAAGLTTRRGILVDDYMQTSQPDIYAAGDVAEHDGIAFGLWPVAAEQGEIAAVNALGGKRLYGGHMPSTRLKVTGIDLLSIGQFNAEGDGVYHIVDEQPESFKYRKLVFASGRLLGAILIGYPDEAGLVSDLVKREADLTPIIPALHRGKWNALAQLEMAA